MPLHEFFFISRYYIFYSYIIRYTKNDRIDGDPNWKIYNPVVTIG